MADTEFVTNYPPLERHREELRAQRRARRLRLAIALPASLLVIALAASWSAPLGVLLAGMAALIVFFLALPGSTSVDPGHLAGVEGEVAVLERLKRLPDEYLVLNRVRLPDETLANGQRELDFIVAGPTGLWVIEVKNTPGHIKVRPGEKHWPIARRAGCGSRPSWNAIPNPVPQARAQVEALERWLLREGVSVRASGLIVMAHSEVAVENARSDEYPVLVRDEVEPFLRQAAGPSLEASATRRLTALASA